MTTKNLTYFIIVIVTALLMTSCERDANVDLPEVDPKIVLRCFISPDDPDIVAKITKSDPVFGSSDVNVQDPVTNAIVTISNGILQEELTYNVVQEAYVIDQSEFPVTAGTTYYMTVVVPGMESVNASTTVPGSDPQISQWSMDITDTLGQDFERRINVEGQLDWNLPPAEQSYYMVQVSRVEVPIQMPGVVVPFLYESFYRNLGASDNDQSSFSLNLKSEYNYFPEFPIDSSYFELFLLNVTKEYYLFNKSITSNSYQDPFSEPTLIYSNVEGGLGIFAGYNGVRVTQESQ